MQPFGDTNPIYGRLQFAGALLCAVFAIFGGRLFQLQILEGESLRDRQRLNSVRRVREEAPRGWVVDREGRVLAGFRSARELIVTPADLQREEQTFAALSRLLRRPAAELRAKVKKLRGAQRFQPVALASDIGWEQWAWVSAHSFAMPGVRTRARPLRTYPQGALAAHLLGSVGEIQASQLGQPGYEGIRAGDVIGQTGLEANFDSHLRGSTGGYIVEVNAAGSEIGEPDKKQPVVPGGRVVLALDLDLQRAVEAAFRNGPSAIPRGPDQPIPTGAAVVVDVQNGDVLALASFPSYDPNAFVSGINAETWEMLSTDEWTPLLNRAIQAHYPPGSVHKAFVAAALLEEGVVDSESSVICPGYYDRSGRRHHCWARGGHGKVNLFKAIQQSCDVYFYIQGLKLGIDRFEKYGVRFGLGRETEIDLPGELPGLLPTTRWKKERFPEDRLGWVVGDTIGASIGQSYHLYTPLQLAVSYAALANDEGALLRPRLALALQDEKGITTKRIERRVLSRLNISRENLEQVRRALIGAVHTKYGTAREARVPGLRIAGKTGTAQVVSLRRRRRAPASIPVRQRDHAWFAALAPAENPRIAVAVFVEHGLQGGGVAAPIAGQIIRAWNRKRLRAAESLAAGRPQPPQVAARQNPPAAGRAAAEAAP